MEPIQLFDIATRKSTWLAARQATLAGNVANANTPGYHARDVAPFADVLAKTQLELAYTDGAHLTLAGTGTADGAGKAEEVNTFDVSESGNDVGIESQMMKAGEVNRDYALTTNIVKSFHNMLLASLKG